MGTYEKSMIPHMESIYGSFTPLERTIADFFIHNTEREGLSARRISQRLYVSEASLSRFAKKCGYRGYREFLFCYEQGLHDAPCQPANGSARLVLNDYQELLNKSYALLDEEQILRIVRILSEKKRIYVYGKGSSGLVGMEMKLRFMRLGVNIEAITDSHIMRMNSALLDPDCAVVGISVSGRTEEVLEPLRMAGRRGAAVILMTSHRNAQFYTFCNEVLLFAVKENLEKGKAISPQFPVLIMVDILYAHLLHMDDSRREALHDSTLEALEESDP